MEGDLEGIGGEHRGLVDDQEPGKRLVKSGCSFGRAINGCIAFDYLLVLLTALIVCGSLGVLNSNVRFAHRFLSMANYVYSVMSKYCSRWACMMLLSF